MRRERIAYAKRLLLLIFGLFVLANGSVLTIQSGWGSAPWVVLNTGMNHTFGISIGTASVLFGCTFVLIAVFLHEPVGLGTVVNMLLAGMFTDLVMALEYIPKPEELWMGAGMLILGILLFLYGTYLYLASGFGAGPRDCMMVSVSRLLHIPIGISRIVLEGAAVLAGWLLGGAVGLGTLLSVLLNGPVLQGICWMHHFDPTRAHHETFRESGRMLWHLIRGEQTDKGGKKMNLGLGGKVAVITGGATGIGREMARIFLEEGCKVAICSRRQSVLEEAKRDFSRQGFEIFIQSVDVCDYAAVKAFAREVERHFGRIDIWVNNAGANQIKPLLEFTPQEFDSLMKVDLYSVFYGCQIAGRRMAQQKGGVILNAASFAALAPNAGRAPYSAAKAGVLSLTRTFAAELAPYGIRVLSYVPGMIRTDMAAGSISRYQNDLLRDIPMQRFGRPEEVARVVAFAASDAASYLNGTHIEISGGKRCVQNPWYGYEEAANTALDSNA